jgi:hypothetical protein
LRKLSHNIFNVLPNTVKRKRSSDAWDLENIMSIMCLDWLEDTMSEWVSEWVRQWVRVSATRRDWRGVSVRPSRKATKWLHCGLKNQIKFWTPHAVPNNLVK